ncbi:MAG: malonyl-ACP O-methyltransferase BioC [Methylophilaceae bacterium]|nr:malonyl-ACP O-methyltransferase BioC [Methylophilaceae bacterium]
MDDPYRIDKRRLRMAFGRAAASYDAAAVLQREVLERMLSRLALIKLSPRLILDAGCGTGLGMERLAARYPAARLIGLDIALPMLRQAVLRGGWWSQLWRPRRDYVCGDVESLPLAAACVDMVWSNLTLQWCNDIPRTFRELHRILRPEGLLMFSTFGPDTLMELRAAAEGEAPYTRVNRFLDMHDIGDALVRVGFAEPVMDVERFVLTYDDVRGLMRDLKAIGAHNATQGRRRGLEGKSFLADLAARYERFRSQGRLPATYEVVYGLAWKGLPRPAADTVRPIQLHRRR